MGKNMKTFIIAVLSLVVLAAIALSALFGFGVLHVGKDQEGNPQLVLPYQWRHPDAPGGTFTVKNAKGEDVEYHRPAEGMMAEPVEVANGEAINYFAPLPVNPVVEAVCSDESLGEASPEPGQWVVPSLADPDSGAQLSGTFHDGSFEVLPSAPDGVRDTLSQPVGSSVGVSTVAGHVNKDWPSGALSNYGQLHHISSCAHIYVGGFDGGVYEYAVTDVDVIVQGDVDSDQRLWRHEGYPGLNFLTCAGEFVGDTGTGPGGVSFDFPYTHNLWVGAKLIHAS